MDKQYYEGEIGKKVVKMSSKSKHGRSRDKPSIPVKNEIYGKLKVLELNNDTKTCKCQCVCQKEISVTFHELLSGRKKTCGCRTRSQGLHNGTIVREVRILKQVEDAIYKSGRKKQWMVECTNCGFKRILRETDLVTGKVSVCPNCKNIIIKEGGTENAKKSI